METKTPQKLRLLCLHGFGTSGDMMKAQMRHLSRLIDPYADLVFANGPKVVSKALVTDPAVHKFMGDKPSYSWFDYRNRSERELIELSVTLLDNFIDKQGPFDGIIGFSQGGALAHLAALLQHLGMLKSPGAKKFKFVVLICSTAWRWDTLEKLVEYKPLLFPSLHIVSKSDFLYNMCLSTTTKFVNPQMIHHGQGHKVPRISAQQFQFVLKFMLQATGLKPKPQLLSSL